MKARNEIVVSLYEFSNGSIVHGLKVLSTPTQPSWDELSNEPWTTMCSIFIFPMWTSADFSQSRRNSRRTNVWGARLSLFYSSTWFHLKDRETTSPNMGMTGSKTCVCCILSLWFVFIAQDNLGEAKKQCLKGDNLISGQKNIQQRVTDHKFKEVIFRIHRSRVLWHKSSVVTAEVS